MPFLHQQARRSRLKRLEWEFLESFLNHLELRKPIILQLGFSEPSFPHLQKFVQTLWQANEELNLFSRQMTFEDLVDNHIIDCLLPLSFFPSNARKIADFGTGGGLPGILYAIHFSKARFQLFEKSPKKQIFLNSLKSFVPNIEVQGLIPSILPGVDLIMARGFKPLDVIIEMSAEHFKNSGHYFLLKGKIDKIEEELSIARKKTKNLAPRIERLKSPVLDVERHLVLI